MLVFFIDSSYAGMLHLLRFSDNFTVAQLSVSAYATCLVRQTQSTSAAHLSTVLLTKKAGIQTNILHLEEYRSFEIFLKK